MTASDLISILKNIPGEAEIGMEDGYDGSMSLIAVFNRKRHFIFNSDDSFYIYDNEDEYFDED